MLMQDCKMGNVTFHSPAQLFLSSLRSTAQCTFGKPKAVPYTRKVWLVRQQGKGGSPSASLACGSLDNNSSAAHMEYDQEEVSSRSLALQDEDLCQP